MKNFEIKPAIEALRKINLSSIKDQAVKNQLLNLSLELLSADRNLQLRIDDTKTAILSPVQSSIDEITRLKERASREKDEVKRKEIFDEIESHTEVIEPSTLLNQKINEALQEESTVKGLKKDDFLAAISELNGIDFSVIEGLFPVLE